MSNGDHGDHIRNAEAGSSARRVRNGHRPPVMASIGTFLIDAFDTPPQPVVDTTPLPPPRSTRPQSPKSPVGPKSTNGGTNKPNGEERGRLTRSRLNGVDHQPILEDPMDSTSPAEVNVPLPGLPSSHSVWARRPLQMQRASSDPTLPDVNYDPNRRPSLPLSSAMTTPLSSSGSRSARPASSSSLPPPSPDDRPGSGTHTPQQNFDDPPPEQPFEILGGGALYALIGARIFLPSSQLRTLVDRDRRANHGQGDLAPDLEAQVNAFGKDMWVWNEGKGKRMVRARIRYDGAVRLFHPIVKQERRTLASLLGTQLQGVEYLHISPPYSSEHVDTLITEIDDLHADGVDGAWRPKIVFEPTPNSCHTEQREWLERVAPNLHVLSPNHEELLSFYGRPQMGISDPNLDAAVEDVMQHLLHNVGIGPNGRGVLVVRCGRKGCVVGTKDGGVRWFPAYWEGDSERKVKDVTGAGNAFLGAYIAGLSLTGDPYEAALYGTVASSFVVEQVGIPNMDNAKLPGTANGSYPASLVKNGHAGERWNGDSPLDRLEKLRRRCDA